MAFSGLTDVVELDGGDGSALVADGADSVSSSSSDDDPLLSFFLSAEAEAAEARFLVRIIHANAAAMIRRRTNTVTIPIVILLLNFLALSALLRS